MASFLPISSHWREGDGIPVMGGGGQGGGRTFVERLLDAGGGVGIARDSGDLAVSDVFLERAKISVVTGTALIVDGCLADFPRAIAGTADHLAVGDDSPADAGAHGNEDDVLKAPAGTAFPLGNGHAVRVVIDHDRQADFFLQDFPERDGDPVLHVGEIVDDALFEIDEAGHADADGGDTRVPCPQVLDGADHFQDELLRSFKFLGRDRGRVIDDVALEDDREFHGGSSEINADGQGAVAHFKRRRIDWISNGTFFPSDSS